jgi:hypothetical protein
MTLAGAGLVVYVPAPLPRRLERGGRQALAKQNGRRRHRGGLEDTSRMDAQTAAQHMRALDRANRVRLARAELKRSIGNGSRDVASVILECPWEAESMAIGDLLLSQHRWGRMRCRGFLASMPMLETKTIGSMTERQRNHVAACLKGEAVAVDPFADRLVGSL